MKWFWNKGREKHAYIYADFTPTDDITIQDITVIVANTAARSPVMFLTEAFDNLDQPIKRHFTNR